jgi:mediator of RNA polymerase II transcription subunit 16
MSTIMDTGYSIDVDDLFGDSEQVNLQAMTAPPPLKGLPGRIDELGASGCCQQVPIPPLLLLVLT